MIINFQKPIEFINKCGCLVDYKELEASIRWFSKRPVARQKAIFMHGRYPAVSIYEQKIHIHRLLKMYWMKRELDSDEYVHHEDGNKLNSEWFNLTLMDASFHQSITHKGRKQKREHVMKRINSTTKTRYGHSIYENPDLLKGGTDEHQ